ncbi:hypothetical protein V8C42DRAFT_338803 [Trichoderma barbatum]
MYTRAPLPGSGDIIAMASFSCFDAKMAPLHHSLPRYSSLISTPATGPSSNISSDSRSQSVTAVQWWRGQVLGPYTQCSTYGPQHGQQRTFYAPNQQRPSRLGPTHRHKILKPRATVKRANAMSLDHILQNDTADVPGKEDNMRNKMHKASGLISWPSQLIEPSCHSVAQMRPTPIEPKGVKPYTQRFFLDAANSDAKTRLLPPLGPYPPRGGQFGALDGASALLSIHRSQERGRAGRYQHASGCGSSLPPSLPRPRAREVRHGKF